VNSFLKIRILSGMGIPEEFSNRIFSLRAKVIFGDL